MSAGSSVISVLKKACGARFPSGSLTSTQRIGLGGVPGRYQSAVSEVISSVLGCLRPYHEDTVMLPQGVAGFESSVFSFGKRGADCTAQADRPRRQGKARLLVTPSQVGGCRRHGRRRHASRGCARVHCQRGHLLGLDVTRNRTKSS